MIVYPAVDPALGEMLSADEASLAEQIGAVIEQSLRADYRPGSVRRDAHPKAHGCVKAEFRVLDSLPDFLSKGIFSSGATYQAWIRFSNGSKDATRPDNKGDVRGMAIKVLGVAGSTLMDDEPATQDFILISHPVFFANDPSRYLSLIKASTGSSVLAALRAPFALGVKGALIALKMTRKKIANPLHTRYWSTVPYQWGTGADRVAVKYSARSCAAVTDPMPSKPGPNFLRDAMGATLSAGDVCMEFLVQLRTSERLSVEDVMTEWSEDLAPFHTVATLRILKQTFDTPAQRKFCENLAFSPWHALPDHRPLGAVNRLRKVIYERISRFRHAMNSTAQPTSDR